MLKFFTETIPKIMAKYSARISNMPLRVRQNIGHEGWGPNHMIEHHLSEIVALSRQATDDNTTGVGSIKTLTGRILSTDIQVIAETGNERLNLQLEKGFNEWIRRNFDMSLYELMHLIARTYLVDGEVFIVVDSNICKIKTTDHCPLRLRDSKNRIYNGIQFDCNNEKVIGYVLTKHTSHNYNDRIIPEYEIFPKHKVFHLINREKVEARRAAGCYPSTLVRLEAIETVNHSELKASQIAALLVGQIHKDSNTKFINTNKNKDKKLGEYENIGFANNPFTGDENSVWIDDLPPGHKIELTNPNGRPNVQLKEFIEGQTNQISRALGIPSSSVSGSYKSSFSSERMASIDSKISLSIDKHRIVEVIEFLYKKYLMLEIAKKPDLFINNKKINNFCIKIDPLPVIDRFKEAKADQIEIQNKHTKENH